MTFYSPRIYTYKITFEEVPYYYYGVHKEKRYNEEYWGSPKTNKWCWELYTPKKQILEIFPYTDEGWIEAQEVETRLVKPFFNADKWCLNENCGGKTSLRILKENGKISGKKTYELGVGVHGLTQEQRIENGRKGGKIGGEKTYALGVGVHGLTPEQMSENGKNAGKIGGKIGGKRTKERGVGFFGLTAEQRIENGKKGGKKSSSQKWKCLETGFVTNPGNLTKYQNARGIDTSKRKRVE